MTARLSPSPAPEFDTDSWNDMLPAERVRRCLLFAHEANQHALDAPAEVRDAYNELSKQWLALAAEIEKSNPDRRLSS